MNNNPICIRVLLLDRLDYKNQSNTSTGHPGLISIDDY